MAPHLTGFSKYTDEKGIIGIFYLDGGLFGGEIFGIKEQL